MVWKVSDVLWCSNFSKDYCFATREKYCFSGSTSYRGGCLLCESLFFSFFFSFFFHLFLKRCKIWVVLSLLSPVQGNGLSIFFTWKCQPNEKIWSRWHNDKITNVDQTSSATFFIKQRWFQWTTKKKILLDQRKQFFLCFFVLFFVSLLSLPQSINLKYSFNCCVCTYWLYWELRWYYSPSFVLGTHAQPHLRTTPTRTYSGKHFITKKSRRASRNFWKWQSLYESSSTWWTS